ALDLVGRAAERVDGAVGLDAIAPPSAAEQVRDRLALELAPDVPERDVDARHGMDDAAAPPDIARAVVHALPERLDVGRILADDAFLEPHRAGVGGGCLDDGADDTRHAVDLGDAGDTGIGVDLEDHVVPGAVEAGGVPARDAQLDDLDVGDLHARFLFC